MKNFKMPSQKQEILQMFNQTDGWICSNVFRANYLPEFRARFNDLRKDGFVIEARTCRQHKHQGQMNEYRLKTSETAPQTTKDHTLDDCPSYNVYKVYCPSCRLELAGNTKEEDFLF